MPARAKLPPGKGKRTPLNMRTTRELRERLEREAADSGRSLAQEVEARLERSFANDVTFEQIFGDDRTQTLLRLVKLAKDMVEQETGKSAFDDRETSAVACAAISRVLDGFLKLPEPAELAKAMAKYEEGLPPNRLALLMGVIEPKYPRPKDQADTATARGDRIAEILIGKTDKLQSGSRPKEKAGKRR